MRKTNKMEQMKSVFKATLAVVAVAATGMGTIKDMVLILQITRLQKIYFWQKTLWLWRVVMMVLLMTMYGYVVSR